MNKCGQLPSGIEVNGQVYREYELREQIVADEVEVLESEHGPRALKSDAFFNVCIIARRLRFKDLEEPVTPEMVMAMASSDFSHLLSAGKSLGEQRESFRDAAQAAPDAPSGTSQAGI